MNFNLKGKVVVVTGGASNIGRAIVVGASKEGAKVAIFDLDLAQATHVATTLRTHFPHVQVLPVRADVTDEKSVAEGINQVVKEYGGVDVLVNCAGFVKDELFVNKPRASWKKEIDINLWGVMNTTHAVLPHMIKANKGSIVNIGSDAGRIGEFQESVYSAAKAGVIAFSKTLAREVGKHNIRLNVICPALTVPKKEDMGENSMWKDLQSRFTDEVLERAKKAYPLRRLGTPEDIMYAVMFFASDASGFITGQTLSVNGGYSML
eukprot:Phypoly_transcript_13436.p1 GENE.Phypoly_transcript_13436~~Phypoly_transcript_13436.p1  ORF type:complete len:264 (+),score=43.42 Phypoly_transcript_13436:195-986(+)